MNRTRKIILAIMVCVVTLFAAACGKKDNTPFSHGSWSGNTYSSDFFGIKITMGTDWTILSDSDLAKSAGISNMSESSIKTVFDKGGYITEMMAAKGSGASVNITVQDSDKTINFSEKDYFTAAPKLMKAQFEAAGYNKCDVYKSAVNFLGKSTDCLELTLTANGKTLYEIQIPVFKSHYTACITFGSFEKPELYSIINMFSAG